jgi:hypothetical protein
VPPQLRAKFEKRARQGDAEFSTREQVESKVKETLEGIMADLKTATVRLQDCVAGCVLAWTTECCCCCKSVLGCA